MNTSASFFTRVAPSGGYALIRCKSIGQHNVICEAFRLHGQNLSGGGGLSVVEQKPRGPAFNPRSGPISRQLLIG